jgi:hypothetical protein
MIRNRPSASPFWCYLLGGVFCVIGLFMALSHASFVASAEHARGEIQNLKTESHGSGRRRSHTTWADVSFTDSRGAAHTLHTEVEDGFGGWDLHEQVDVVYPSGAPELARVGGFQNQWGIPLLLVFFGLISIGYGWLQSPVAGKPRS